MQYLWPNPTRSRNTGGKQGGGSLSDRGVGRELLNISDTQLSYITNVDAGHELIKVVSSLVPFANKFPKNTKLYKLMTAKPSEGA